MTARDDWYREAFGPLTAAFWTALVAPETVDAEARFLAAALGAPAGGSILDVPCGAGRHARALARLGYRVDGVDVSPHMLAAARHEGDVAGVTLRLGDMASLDAGRERHDGAFCWGNSFGYLRDEATRGFVGHVARALRPGARFVLETGAVAENVLASFQPRTEMEIAGHHFTAERGYVMAESAMHVRYRVARGEAVEAFEARQVVYTTAEIVRMAASAGLRLLALHGGIAGEPAGLGRRLIAVFQR